MFNIVAVEFILFFNILSIYQYLFLNQVILIKLDLLFRIVIYNLFDIILIRYKTTLNYNKPKRNGYYLTLLLKQDWI